MSAIDYLYRWAWKGHDTPRQRCCLRRQGQRCRVLARGALNSALLEFEDGYRVVTSRNGLRRIGSSGEAGLVTHPASTGDAVQLILSPRLESGFGRGVQAPCIPSAGGCIGLQATSGSEVADAGESGVSGAVRDARCSRYGAIVVDPPLGGV